MRTRSVTQLVPISSGTSVYTRYHPTVPYWTSIVEGPYITNIGAVEDASGGLILGHTIIDEEPRQRYEGYCHHTTNQLILLNMDAGAQFISSGGLFLDLHYSGGFLTNSLLRTRIGNWVQNPSDIVIRQANWDQLSYEAMQVMSPSFSDLSLANDLLELKQIKDLVKPFGKMKTSIGKLSSAFLWKKFGVDPLVSSIVGVVELVRSLTKRIADIRAKGKRLQTRHFSRNLDTVTAPVNTTPLQVHHENPTDPDFEVKISRSFRWVMSPKYTATLRFRYDLSSLSDLEVKCRAWLQASGLDNLLSVVWNAIPFSFVIDWFINVGEWVDSLLGEQRIPIVIVDFSHSVKYGYRLEFNVSIWSGRWVGPGAYYETKYYERKRANPLLVSTLHLNMPRIGHVLLGQALIGQGTDSARHKLQENSARRRIPPLPLKVRVGVQLRKFWRNAQAKGL